MRPGITEFNGPTEEKTFSCILPMQLYQFSALTLDRCSLPLADAAGSLPPASLYL